jgi:hypothetical protein
MPSSELAERLLRLHVDRRGQLFYGTDVLGSIFRDRDIVRLDDAYRELETLGFMEPAGPFISYFGDPKRIYRVTEEGAKHVAQGSAA